MGSEVMSEGIAPFLSFSKALCQLSFGASSSTPDISYLSLWRKSMVFGRSKGKEAFFVVPWVHRETVFRNEFSKTRLDNVYFLLIYGH